MKNEANASPFENIYIERKSQTLRIKVRHSYNSYKQLGDLWYFLSEFVTLPAIFIGFALGACCFCTIAFGGFEVACTTLIVLLIVLPAFFRVSSHEYTPRNQTSLLTLSKQKIEFKKNGTISTFTKPLIDIDLRREGHDEGGYSVFTLYLIFKDRQVPTLASLSKEESKYIAKLVRNFMQLGDELFYPAEMPLRDEQAVKGRKNHEG